MDGQLHAGYLPCSNPGNPQPATINQQPAFLPITACPIAAPILWRATEAFLALLNQQPCIWLRNSHQIPDQLELFTTADESRLQLTLYLRTATKSLPKKLAFGFTALCETLRTRVPELSGAGIALLPALSKQRNRRSEQPRPGPTWGGPGLNYTVAPLEPRTLNLGPQTYWVPRGAFFQINRFLLPELLALVTNNRTGQAFDLYAGVGLFSRALAAHFSKVTAVEIAEPAFTALAANASSQTSAPSKPPPSTFSAPPSSNATAPASSSSIRPAPAPVPRSAPCSHASPRPRWSTSPAHRNPFPRTS